MKQKSMNTKQHSQSGQAIIEMCICVLVILIVFLGLIFVGGLGIANMQNLIKAKDAAETHSRVSEKSMEGDDISAWDYRSQQQQQRHTTEPDFFPSSHIFYSSHSGNINPFAASDRMIIPGVNKNKPTAPVPSDFQSSFLRELSPSNQAKRNGAAANSASRSIPSLFVGIEDVSGNRKIEGSELSDTNEN